VRQAPFFCLGLAGICGDYYAVQSLCSREA